MTSFTCNLPLIGQCRLEFVNALSVAFLCQRLSFQNEKFIDFIIFLSIILQLSIPAGFTFSTSLIIIHVIACTDEIKSVVKIRCNFNKEIMINFFLSSVIKVHRHYFSKLSTVTTKMMQTGIGTEYIGFFFLELSLLLQWHFNTCT